MRPLIRRGGGGTKHCFPAAGGPGHARVVRRAVRTAQHRHTAQYRWHFAQHGWRREPASGKPRPSSGPRNIVVPVAPPAPSSLIGFADPAAFLPVNPIVGYRYRQCHQPPLGGARQQAWQDREPHGARDPYSLHKGRFPPPPCPVRGQTVPRSRARLHAACGARVATSSSSVPLFLLLSGCQPPRGLQSRDIFLSQPILLELEAPLKICGKPMHVILRPQLEPSLVKPPCALVRCPDHRNPPCQKEKETSPDTVLRLLSLCNPPNPPFFFTRRRRPRPVLRSVAVVRVWRFPAGGQLPLPG